MSYLLLGQLNGHYQYSLERLLELRRARLGRLGPEELKHQSSYELELEWLLSGLHARHRQFAIFLAGLTQALH
jgi:hypothetical protein